MSDRSGGSSVLDPQAERRYISEWSYVVMGGAVQPASEQLFEKIAQHLKAMADPTRLRILHLLHDGELCVNDVLKVVGGSQANVSKHLAVLRRAGLVECRRDGVNAYYRIHDPSVFVICRGVCDSLERQLNADRKFLKRGRAAVLVGGGN